ncbi:MAG: TIM-barrel domain-containing protein [Planctomycetota bacterium]
MQNLRIKLPDFTMTAARAWWADYVEQYLLDTGIDGVWNDMNEPAVFRYPQRTMPLSNVHRADPEFGGLATHERFHNVWGMLNARATVEGFERAYPDRRPFVLTRANYIGGQRYAAGWTGDNGDDWYHIDTSIPMTLNLGLSGMPFIGPDIGGFIGNSSPDRFARWMGFGSMLPFARGHTGGGPKEPWFFGPQVEQTSRLAIQRRYRLLPHIYTAFREAHLHGQPVARPLFFLDPANPELRDFDEAFLLGDGLIVAAAPHPSATPRLPDVGQSVYRFAFGQTNTPGAPLDLDPDLPLLYAVGGHAIPTQPIVQSAREPQNTEITLIVALDENGQATGTLYEDAGDGHGYLAGDFLLSEYLVTETGGTVTVSLASEIGNMLRPARTLNVRLLTGTLQEVAASGVDGQTFQFAIPARTPSHSGFESTTDGRHFHTDFALGPVEIQENPTGFGDNLTELNALYIQTEPDGVRVAISGNLEPNFNGLALLIDTDPGGPNGQNTLDTANAPTPPDGPNTLSGLTLAPEFRPDLLYFINNGQGVLYADRFELLSGGVSKTYLGRTTINSGADLLIEGTNANGVRIAYDNDNRLGVTDAMADAGAAAGVDRGLELFLPFDELGLASPFPCGELRLQAFVLAPNGFVANQFLPAAAPGTPNVGFDRGPLADGVFQSAGAASHVLRGVADVADFDTQLPVPDGRVDLIDFSVFLAFWATDEARADIASFGECTPGMNDGVVDLTDFSCYLSAWALDCDTP